MTSTAVAREIERYVAKVPKSRALQAEAEQVLPGGSSRGTAYFAPYPFYADHGDGHYVYDIDGNRYLDFMLNATTLILGHANPDGGRGARRADAQGHRLQHADRGAGPGREAPLRPRPLARHDPLQRIRGPRGR